MFEYNIQRHIITCLVITLLMCSQANGEVTVAVYAINGLYEPSGDGQYDQIIKEAQDSHHPITLKHLPIVEAQRAFKSKTVDCLSPSDQLIENFPFPVIQSNAFNIAKAYVFWRADEYARPKLEQLNHLVVGYQEGVGFHDQFEKLDIKLQESHSIEAMYKALIEKKIDVFLSFTPDIWALFDSKELPNISYEINKPFLTYRDSIVCHKTDSAEITIQAFNKKLHTLDEIGRLRNLLDVNYSRE
ncbi:MAG TPA: hypothetical protein ENI05_05240 [Porticoccus sp.]|nr:hypothetical protein [Porticoccus sp.]